MPFKGFCINSIRNLLEILKADDESEITVEGMIEDIDILRSDGSIEALQCKYHESRDKYVQNIIFRPLLQMMEHFASTNPKNIRYKLFIYIPNETLRCRNVELEEIESALHSASYRELVEKINTATIDKSAFQKVCVLEFGKSLVGIEEDVIKAFKTTSLAQDSIDHLFYPNSINEIARLSIRQDELSRAVRRKEFLKTLESIHKTQISKWTLGLRSRDEILKHKRKQLKNNLSKNSRNRCLVISQHTIQEFDDQIVLFIQAYINVYHFKANHDKPPTFYLDCASDLFIGIRQRLHDKGIKFTTGSEIRDEFDNDYFYRDPIIRQIDSYQVVTDFQIRISRHRDMHPAIQQRGFDDVYIVSESSFDVWNQDVEIECLPFTDFNHLK